jgi:hypothetical protein
MKESEYKRLCQACDSLLLTRSSRIFTLAIPWLHIIREHPMFLKNYHFGGKSAWFSRDRFFNIALFFKYLAAWFLHLIRSIGFKSHCFSFSGSTPPHIDVLFISHYLNVSQSGKVDDFYFGGVPEVLSSRGYKVAIALINHSAEHERDIAYSWTNSNTFRIVLHKSLGFLSNLRLFVISFEEFLDLLFCRPKMNDKISKSIYSRAVVESISGGTRNTLRIYEQIKALNILVKPRVILATYEGHAWERLAFLAAREVNPCITCVGYQHAALFRLQHSIKRSIKANLDPDIILTSGLISKQQFEEVVQLKNTPVIVLGSNRSFNLNQLKKDSVLQVTDACLVLPEGELSECNILFEYSLKCARRHPDVNFIWRLHPLITFDTLIKNNPIFAHLPSNITLSTSSLEEDISRCKYSLYRGSTAIVQAIGAGIRPIYLEISGEMTIDPLYSINSFKSKVLTIEDFSNILMRKNMDSLIKKDQEDLIAFCHQFFIKFDPKIIVRILKDNKQVNRNSNAEK